LRPSVALDAELDAVIELPSGIVAPRKTPVFLTSPKSVKAVAKIEASYGSPRDQEPVMISERLPEASWSWMKLALRLELSKGNGMPNEMRLSALGGRAFAHIGQELTPPGAYGAEYANKPPKRSWWPVYRNRDVTDARSS
jgi:hypothetical protein